MTSRGVGIVLDKNSHVITVHLRSSLTIVAHVGLPQLASLYPGDLSTD